MFPCFFFHELCYHSYSFLNHIISTLFLYINISIFCVTLSLSQTVLHCVRAMETLPCPPPAAPGTSASVTTGWRASPSPASLTGSSATPWAPVWMLPTARRTAVLSPILCGAEHMLFEALTLTFYLICINNLATSRYDLSIMAHCLRI